MKKTLNYFYYSCSAGEGKKNLANPVRNWSLWVSNGAKINEKAHIPGFFQLIIGVEILPLRHFGCAPLDKLGTGRAGPSTTLRTGFAQGRRLRIA